MCSFLFAEFLHRPPTNLPTVVNRLVARSTEQQKVLWFCPIISIKRGITSRRSAGCSYAVCEFTDRNGNSELIIRED
jgi:hypothetical protein